MAKVEETLKMDDMVFKIVTEGFIRKRYTLEATIPMSYISPLKNKILSIITTKSELKKIPSNSKKKKNFFAVIKIDSEIAYIKTPIADKFHANNLLNILLDYKNMSNSLIS